MIGDPRHSVGDHQSAMRSSLARRLRPTPHGRELPVLRIVDAIPRLSPTSEPCFALHGADALQVLERFSRQVGLLATIQADQSTKAASPDLDLSAYRRDVMVGLSCAGRFGDRP
jgi:hypothetical protein